MLDNDNWLGFIESFFPDANQRWIKHVLKNWNHVDNVPGCKCLYLRFTPPIHCQAYLDILEHTVEVNSETTKTTEFPELEAQDEQNPRFRY